MLSGSCCLVKMKGMGRHEMGGTEMSGGMACIILYGRYLLCCLGGRRCVNI